MDFELSVDQEALREAAADLLAGRSPMSVVRGAVERDGVPDAALWEAMVEQGWAGVLAAEAAGGMGFGWVEAAVLAEQIGATLAPSVVVGHMVASDLLARSEWAPRLADGSVIGAASADLSSPVISAPDADVVVAAVDGQVVVVDLRSDRPEPQPAMDLTRRLGWVGWGDGGGVSVEVGAEVGDEVGVEVGGAAVDRLIDAGAVAYSAELLGIAQRALDLAVAYAGERVQFGKPIGSFQAVKHRCADMLVDVEGMRSATYWAAWCVAERHEDASVAASTAKLWCSDAAMRVLAGAMQVHGGIGFTWEHDLHLYLKRAQLDSLAFGSASFHRTRLAALLRARVRAGRSVV